MDMEEQWQTEIPGCKWAKIQDKMYSLISLTDDVLRLEQCAFFQHNGRDLRQTWIRLLQADALGDVRGGSWLHKKMSVDSKFDAWSMKFPVLICLRNVYFLLNKMLIEGCMQ